MSKINMTLSDGREITATVRYHPRYRITPNRWGAPEEPDEPEWYEIEEIEPEIEWTVEVLDEIEREAFRLRREDRHADAV